MKTKRGRSLILVLILGFIGLSALECSAYLEEILAAKRAPRLDAVLEVGTMPSPLPSRRQIIDADKGASCLLCHRMPYPTAPQKPSKPGETVLSSIQTTPPGGLRLLTSASPPLNSIAGAWSPDGKQVAYSINLFQKDWDIWVIDADGKNRRPLISGSAIDMAPDWSRDGKSILFQSNRSGNSDIWMMEIASKQLTQLTQDPGQEILPKWSPDGKRIVFQSNRSGDEEIWVMEIANGQWTQLTNSPAKDENPVFSPS
jgi:dipeptidyl aminopeptidase/acylaminoacyl peptidase